MHLLFSDRKKKKKKKNPETLTSKDKVPGKHTGNLSGMHDFIEATRKKAWKVSISWKKEFEPGSLKIKYHGHLNPKQSERQTKLQ